MRHPIVLFKNNLTLYMQKVKIKKKKSVINIILNLKILSTLIYKNFLPDFPLHYPHNLMKGLCVYYTPDIHLFTNFKAQSGGSPLFSSKYPNETILFYS